MNYREMAKMLSEKGRGGDTMLAHVNPLEAAVLKMLGGSGTTNPNTGLREFKMGRGFGGGMGKSAPGGKDPVGGGKMSVGKVGREPSGKSPVGDIGKGGVDTGGIIGDAISGMFDLPTDIPDAVSDLMPGAKLGKGFLDMMGRLSRAHDWGRTDVSEGRRGGPDLRRTAYEAAPTFGGGGPSFSRPGALGLPASLGLDPSLSELQQRTNIATQGVFGDPRFTGEEARQYYGNLAQRALINDQGIFNQFGDIITPVEQSYATRLGLSYEPTSESFFGAFS